MFLKRLTMIVAVTALVSMTCFDVTPALAKAKEFIGSLPGPIETAQGQGMEYFGKRVGELTNGEYSLKVFPNSQLGKHHEVLEQLQNGQVDMMTIPPGYLAEYAPAVQAVVVPFIFRDFEHWKATVDGPIGRKLYDIAKKDAKVLILGYFGGSVRNLVSKKKVTSLDGVKNLLLRLHPSDVQLAAWQSVGAIPTVVAYPEIYNALQLGVIDALENEPEWVTRMKFYEQAKYIVLTKHEIVTRPLLFSAKVFEGLPANIQKKVIQAGAEAAKYQRELEHKLDGEFLAALKDKYGAEIIDIDRTPFREKAAKAVKPAIKKLGIEDLVEEISRFGK